MSPFTIEAFGAVLLVVIMAAVVRGRFFAIFAAVVLGVQALIAVGLHPLFAWADPVYYYLQITVALHFGSLAFPNMRPMWFRYLVSYPALFFAAGCFLALPFSVIAAFGFDPYGAWIPFVIGGFGLFQSLYARPETIDLQIDRRAADATVSRHPRGEAGEARPLSIVQITDPHLGPLMSVRRLHGICERAVAREPDLIMLTGDFLTMESQRDPRVLTDALAPLKAYEGRVFACMGNHDHEAPDLVVRSLAECRVQLLVDEAAVVETPSGPVQILAADFSFRDRQRRLQALVDAHPRLDGHLRIVLLHDPGAFKHLPEGEGDLVLSGHTHGGQVGLLSLGLNWTFVSGFTSIPDHGFWARGRDRLYVHRGTGVYGFPVRVGVPGEESLMRIHRVDSNEA